MQAIEAIKLIIGIGEPLIGKLIHFDALKMKFREFKLRRDPKCPVCSDHPTITELIDKPKHDAGIVVLSGAAVNQDGDVVTEAEARMLVSRRAR